ncbi:MFS transporter [Roseibium aquae]|uniref:MFS transporter n=1 Tax=Roseibium aquae TaxID=1323746 RepID=A0A916TBK4_9HYPH|nr:MFS transporter [Roseibium aquae]GGB37075.1 MFS transporter [Roseibium aquae]
MLSQKTAVSAAVGTLFASHFFGFGLFLPFFPMVLEAGGLSAESIGLVLGIATGARIAAAPVLTNLSDRAGQRRKAMLLYSLGGCLFLALFWIGSGFWSALVTTIGLMAFWAPIVPLSDAYALDVVRRFGADYGRMRLWGSVAFVLANLAGGALAQTGAAAWLVALMGLSILATGLVAIALPASGVGGKKPDGAPARLDGVFRRPWFWVFLGVAGLLQATHAGFYGFGTLFWIAAGLGTFEIGILWSIGVAAEILLFFMAARFSPVIGPLALLGMSAIAAVVRWSLFPFALDFWSIAALQLLHGLSFGAAHLGAVAFLGRVVPPEWGGTGQGLLTTSSGLLTAAGIVLCGWLYAFNPALAFYAMAAAGAVAGLGLVLALPALRRQNAGTSTP